MSDRIYLQAPYEARDQVKAAGGRWDRETKSWYIPPGVDPEPFAQWRAPSTAPTPHDEFSDALRRAGFLLSGGHPLMDGQIHRVPVGGDKGMERNGSYLAFSDGIPNGWYQNFKTTDEPIKWKSGAGNTLNEEERASLAATAATNKRAAEQQRRREAAAAAQRAAEILTGATPAVSHPYLTAKRVAGDGLFIAAPGTVVQGAERPIDISGRLLVPIRNATGDVTSLQIIDDQGGKMFLRGGRVAGGQHVIGDISSPWPVHIAEGYATARTIHDATGQTVVVAFTAHNMAAVASATRAATGADRSIYLIADNDRAAVRNVGLDAAAAAAAAVGGHVLVPTFKPDEPGSDWNDAANARGMDAVRLELQTGQAVGTRRRIAREIAQTRSQETERGRSRDMELTR